MKTFQYLFAILLLSNHSSVSAQTDSVKITKQNFSGRTITLEPGLGIKPGPTSPAPGLLLSSLMQWNLTIRISIISHSSYTYNNAFLKSFNFINSDYNYSLSQKFGLGYSLYTKHSTHTFSLLAGIINDAFQETLNNPESEKVAVSESMISPDCGLMYNLKIGNKKYFFSYRMYLRLYPYPFKSTDITSIDGNISNISLEIGLGIRI